MSLDLSIIIPAYNRVELLRYTLESVKRAIKELKVEIIVVDDGSQEPISNRLNEFACLPIHIIRQENQGLVIAKNNGFKAANGEYVLFLDSDDLVHPDKLVTQIACLNEQVADVSYSDTAVTNLTGEYDSLIIQPSAVLPVVTSPAEFYLKIQPSPHNPIYRRSYLQKYLNNPLIPESRIFNPVGEIWIYYNLAIHPAKIVKTDGYYTIQGNHHQNRITQNWERMGVASLALMLAFVKNCPKTQDTVAARQQVGECAFTAWRKLPTHFNRTFEEMMLGIWRSSPNKTLPMLGGRKFQLLAQIIGIENAARILRYFQRPNYQEIKTISDVELQKLVASFSKI